MRGLMGDSSTARTRCAAGSAPAFRLIERIGRAHQRTAGGCATGSHRKGGNRAQKKSGPQGPPVAILNPGGAQPSVLGLDPFAVGHFTLVHTQAEAAFGVGAYPGFKNYRSAFLAVV